MEASPTAAEVVLPPRPTSPEGGAFPDPLEEFNLRLEDIIRTFGSAAAALDSQVTSPNQPISSRQRQRP